MVDLSHLRCLRPECPDPRRLTAVGDGTLMCGSCGDRRSVGDYFRPYGKVTGQWIIGATVLSALSLARLPGRLRLIGIGIGIAIFAYSIWRILWQAKVIKSAGRR